MLGNHLASKLTAEVAPLLLHLLLVMEKILSYGSFLKKQEQPMGFHREDWMVQDLSKQHLPICFFPEAEEEILWLNSFTVTYLPIHKFCLEEIFAHAYTLVMPAFALSILPSLLPALW